MIKLDIITWKSIYHNKFVPFDVQCFQISKGEIITFADNSKILIGFKV